MGVGTVTVVMAGVGAATDESSSVFSSSMRGTAGASDERSFRIFLEGQTDVRFKINTFKTNAVLVLSFSFKLVNDSFWYYVVKQEPSLHGKSTFMVDALLISNHGTLTCHKY